MKSIKSIIDKIFKIQDNEWKFSKTFYFLGIKITFKKKYPPKFFANKIVHSGKRGNCILSDLIKSNKPFSAIRMGYSELLAVDWYLKNKNQENLHFPEEKIKFLRQNAGFFLPNDVVLKKYCEDFIKIVRNSDLLFTVLYFPMESNVIKAAKPKILAHADTICHSVFEYKEPWVQYLEGKKVLIIHPFENTIKNQFPKLKTLFKNPKLAPSYELITLKTLQTIDEEYKNYNYKDWFEALEYMYGEIDKKDFDIAIIAGGAYGMFLANYIKERGKQAIEMCGTTQLLFGIKGARWDEINLYNENWVRPLDEERPKNILNFIKNETKASYW